jgi:hypothetical protein
MGHYLQEQKKGGLGVKNIRKMNVSLLCKWWWKLENEEGLWKSIVRAKYLNGGSLIGAIKHKPDDSPVWYDLLKIRHIYLKGRTVKVKNGKSTLFWEDPWLRDTPLCVLYPVLYDLCKDKYISVYSFILTNAQLHFTRWLPPFLFDSWLTLINEVYSFPFDNNKDIISWKCNKTGSFSTKSTYDMLTSAESGHSFRHIWKARIPHRIKVFLWLMELRAILTKENLIRRNWSGDPTCYFCSENENIDHLFFLCPIALCLGAYNIPENLHQSKEWIKFWLPDGQPVYTLCLAAVCWAIWKRRNEACFENKQLRNSSDILIYVGALLTYWAGLYGSEMQGKILEGVKILVSCVHKVMVQQRRSPPPPPAH